MFIKAKMTENVDPLLDKTTSHLLKLWPVIYKYFNEKISVVQSGILIICSGERA
jgi:hypothetical protein